MAYYPNNIYYRPQPDFQAMRRYSDSLTNTDFRKTFGVADAQTAPQSLFDDAGKISKEGAIGMGTQVAAAATSLLPVEENIYKFDKFAPVKGMAKGAAMGAQFGPMGAAIGGAVGLIGGTAMEAIQNRNALKNVNTDIQGYQFGATGQPDYLGGNINRGLENLDEVQKSDSIFNKRLRSKAKEKLGGAIEAQQTAFNEASQNFNQEQIARENYRARRNMTNRIYNLYSI